MNLEARLKGECAARDGARLQAKQRAGSASFHAVPAAMGRKAPEKAPEFFQFGNKPQFQDCVAGAEGIEPSNAGIKIQCLTTWRRPNGRPQYSYIGGDSTDGRTAAKRRCRRAQARVPRASDSAARVTASPPAMSSR